MWMKKDAMEAAARGEGCLGGAADDEPVFILRGQDATMPYMLTLWADVVERQNNGNNSKTLEARKFAKEVVAWQHRNKTKIPD